MPFLIIFRCFSSSLRIAGGQSKTGGNKENQLNQSFPEGTGCFGLYTVSWTNVTDLMWFDLICREIYSRLSYLLSKSELLLRDVCDYWKYERALNKREDLSHDRIYKDLINGTASLLTKAIIPTISLFQNHSLTSFLPLIQSHRGEEDSLAHPYLKENPQQVPEALHVRITWKGAGLLKVNKLAVGFSCFP